MEMERSKSRHEGREERDDMEVSPSRDGRRKEKEHRSKDRDKDYERDKNRDKERERDKDHRRDREKERDRRRERDGDIEKESGRAREKEREKEKGRDRDRDRDKDREKERERDRMTEREKEKERDKHKEREKERDNEKDREKEKIKEKSKEKDKEAYKDKDRSRDKERLTKKSHEDADVTSKTVEKYGYGDSKDAYENDDNADGTSGGKLASALDLEERISKMREERLMKKSEGASEVLAWVGKSRKIEEKRNAQKERAQQLSRVFEEQDNLALDQNEDDGEDDNVSKDLAGVKILHGLDKVVEGGAVVLTLKDQSILADGDVNNETDMLENVEIGEQKRRDEAYKESKKKTGIYDDKFSDEPGAEKKILPQYDEPTNDEGITLDEKGRFTGEAEKKLDELRRRLQGQVTSHFEDLSSSAKISSDYYTQEEMLRFKKPKKKKFLRKKEKLDIAALEAEAVASGLGAEDLGSRKDGRSLAMREERERSEAEKRSNAYQAAYAKADEASKLLRMEQVQPVNAEDENAAFADDDEDLYKSLERARRLALKKKEGAGSGPQAVAHLATAATSQPANDKNPTGSEAQENKVVFTEMEEFVWGLQLDEDVRKPESEDVFMDEDEPSKAPAEEREEEPSGWTEVKDSGTDVNSPSEVNEEVAPDETIHEVAVGKGLSSALKLLKERGTLKETVEWGGRNMDKKKSKLIGIMDDDETKERFKDIRIERTDEFGRTLTPKEAFRTISHKFHGKGPGKMKQEKRMKQYQEELKLKQMKNSDTPSLSVERMREAQARLKTPYLVLSGQVKPGQTSDPQSGFATVEKDVPGSLTPMLGDKKVEHFLGIKRKAESGNWSAPKKPKP